MCNEPAENDAVEEEIADDPLFDPEPVGGLLLIKHPNEIGDDWHPCRDFLDPLADEVEEWLRASEAAGLDFGTEPTTIERLTYIIFGIVENGPGSLADVAAWRRACAWFDVRGQSKLWKRIEKGANRVWKKTNKLERRLKDWLPEGASPEEDEDEARSWNDESEFQGFLVTVVEPFVAKLRNWSCELKRLQPLGHEERGGGVAVGLVQTPAASPRDAADARRLPIAKQIGPQRASSGRTTSCTRRHGVEARGRTGPLMHLPRQRTLPSWKCNTLWIDTGNG